MLLSLVLFILFVPGHAKEDWSERYLTEKMYRKENTGVYFVMGRHSRQGQEVIWKKRQLRQTIDPCGEKKVNYTMDHTAVRCNDILVEQVMDRNKNLVKEMCDRLRAEDRSAGKIGPFEESGFDVYWATEDTCVCSRECSDGTIIDKWPTCSCEKNYKDHFVEISCDFRSNCSWDWEGFIIDSGASLPYAKASVRNTKKFSYVASPYYTQISSSCTLGFFYNLYGQANSEIRVVLEWRQYPGAPTKAEDIIIDRIKSFQKLRSVLDYHAVRIGFVYKHARVRIDCGLTDGIGAADCLISNITWTDCADFDTGRSVCHDMKNPTYCQKEGHLICLEDVACDGIVDCANGEDEKNCLLPNKVGMRCDFDNATSSLCTGWEETSFPPSRLGRLFTTGSLLPNMNIVDKEGKTLYGIRTMRKAARETSGNFMVLNPTLKQDNDGRTQFYLTSPLFPPTRQLSLDSYRPEATCTVRFRYCLIGEEDYPSLEIETHRTKTIWEGMPTNSDRRGTLCVWRQGSANVPRQLLPFRLRWSMVRKNLRALTFFAVDDFSLHPSCFDPNSTPIYPVNMKFSTCEKTGSDLPEYDSCLRESHSNGGSDVAVNETNGLRNVIIAKDGYYRFKMCGAAGGSFPSRKGGKASCVVGTRYLHEGAQLQVVIGQKGVSPCDSESGSMAHNQQLVYEHICNKGNTTLPELIGDLSTFYLGAGGGGASMLRSRSNIFLVAGGGGGAFPVLPPVPDFKNSSNGNGLSFNGRMSLDLLTCEQCKSATPSSFSEPGKCNKYYPFPVDGGFGGGGTSCGTGGGGGGGYKGGAFGRFASGEAGSSFINSTFFEHTKESLTDVNDGEGYLELVLCSLDCPGEISYCEFSSFHDTSMECVCSDHNTTYINGTCVSKHNAFLDFLRLLRENFGIIFVVLFFLLASVFVLPRVRDFYRSKWNFDNKEICVIEHTPLVELTNESAQEILMQEDINKFKSWDSETLVNFLPQLNSDQLTIHRELGRGAFGNVCLGTLRKSDGSLQEVAVKSLIDNGYDTENAARSFLMEAVLMRFTNTNCENTITLLGVCFDKHPHRIVMELMRGGNLLYFLRSSRITEDNPNPNNLRMKDLFRFAADVASGCTALEKMQFLHRDLAARNCLLTTTGPDRRVKIADFGLATELQSGGQYIRNPNKIQFLPVRWMPPEAIEDGVYSTKTDVWSFGVVCWEIFNLGKMPLPQAKNENVPQFIEGGGRCPIDETLPEEIKCIMEECWCDIPEERPSFMDLRERLERYVQNPIYVNMPVPKVYRRGNAQSPLVESPIFPTPAGTPCTVETTLPTPMEEDWNVEYDRHPLPHIPIQIEEPTGSFAYETPNSRNIENDAYFVRYKATNGNEVPQIRVTKRPTNLPLKLNRPRPL